MIDVEDDGEAWLWVRHRTRPAPGITGKHLFFSPDRALLVEIARQEIAEHGFAHAKVSRSLSGTQTDYVLCLYDTGPERVGELRRRHQHHVRCPGWKSDEATERGEYSQRYLDSLRKPPRTPVPTTSPPEVPTPLYTEQRIRMTVEEALELQIGDAARRKLLQSVGSDVLIDAVIERRRRNLRGGRVEASSWREILKAWASGDREEAALLFQEHYGQDSGWAGQIPWMSEVERLEITPKPRTPRPIRVPS